jgi:hypothetical protein
MKLPTATSASRRRGPHITAAALSLLVACTLPAQQTLAARVAAVGNGTAQFEFPARDGVCGDGRSYIRVNDSWSGSFNSQTDRSACEPGPVRIVLTVTNSRVTSLRDYAGPVPPLPNGVTELGVVSAAEGSSFLLNLVEAQSEGRVVNRAVFPAMLGRDVVAWPTLLRIAKADRTGRRGSKHDVIFWLAQYAAAKVSGSDDPFLPREGRDDDDEGVKQHAVFALSQLDNGEGIDPLIQVARTNKDQSVRAKAMFWLGESGDPRALALFEQILTSRSPAPRG